MSIYPVSFNKESQYLSPRLLRFPQELVSDVVSRHSLYAIEILAEKSALEIAPFGFAMLLMSGNPPTANSLTISLCYICKGLSFEETSKACTPRPDTCTTFQ